MNNKGGFKLKQLLADCGISQAELQRRVAAELGKDVSRATINLCVNRGYIPETFGDAFVIAVQQVIIDDDQASAWLDKHGIQVDGIWTADNGRRQGKNKKKRQMELIPADGGLGTTREVEMISNEAMRHFKLFRNPFIDDIQKDADVFMSDEHRYIEAAMLDSARHGGFLAVIGEVGSGKTVMRRKVIEQLKRDGDTLVIFPQMIDKTRLTAASICDAIVQDVSSERCRSKLEDKTRQVQRLLLDRAKSGYRACLIVEEAHDLKVNTLKYLKRFYELEDGYKKLLGIILIGQTELKHRFNESQNVDMREVIRRVQVAEIKGLDNNLREYLQVKFKRVGKEIDDIFSDDAFETMGKRLTMASRDGRRKESHAYPLTVNNMTAKAMNMAYDLGETRITADVIAAI